MENQKIGYTKSFRPELVPSCVYLQEIHQLQFFVVVKSKKFCSQAFERADVKPKCIHCPKSEHRITFNWTCATNAKLYGAWDSAAHVFSNNAETYADMEWLNSMQCERNFPHY